jgi:hypothetical protein
VLHQIPTPQDLAGITLVAVGVALRDDSSVRERDGSSRHG